MGTTNRKQVLVIILIVGLLVGVLTTTASPFIKPPIPGDMKQPFPIYRMDPGYLAKDTSLFAPTDYSSSVIERLLQNLTESMVIEYITDLTSFGPRVTASDACDEAASYIYQEFQSMGLEVRYQNWSSSSSLFGANIEATITGVDEPEKIFIVCGHYDSVPGSPGADDNAAGTTAVLSAAYLMKDYSFNHTIRFVCFSGEEQGLYGSRYYALEAFENNDTIIGVLNADMMGYANDDDSRSKVRVYDDEDDSIWLTEYTTDVSVAYYDTIGLSIVPSGYTWGSDHYRFWEVGYNAIFYFEYEFNPNYHSHRDTIETMDTGYATRVSQLILATLASLAEPVDVHCPKIPQIISGVQQGRPMSTYEYEIITTDPYGADVYYLINWGDDTDSGWLGPSPSGESITVSKTWESRGTYEVTVKAKNTAGYESDWSGPYPVRMPYVFQRTLLPLRIRDILYSFIFIK